MRENKADYILSIINDYDIYAKYLGQSVDLVKHLNSPFRKDKIPSLSFIQSSKTGMILWRDWGDYSQTSPEWVFSFVMKIYGCTFNEAIDHIEEDFLLDGSSIPQVKLEKKIFAKKSKRVLSINRRAIGLVDKKFWDKYGISIQTLNKFNVLAVKEVFLDGNYIKRSSATRPIYAYTIRHEGETFYKIYDPLSYDKKYKWLYNGNQDALLGFDQLPLAADLVVITKSLKDVMSLYEYGINAFSLQSENLIPNKELYAELSKRFKRIALFYDNDEPGRVFSSMISNIYHTQEIFIPNEFDVKDISDYVNKYGKTKGKILMKQLITEIYKDG